MTTQAQIIPFGEWLPDLPAYDNPGALEVKNCIPQKKSYRPLGSLSAYSDALDNPCLGAFWAQDSSAVVLNFSGDSGKLYRLDSGDTWTDVSGTSAPYSAANWEFTKFGDRIIAVSRADAPQYYDMGSSSVFADLPGSPPKAKTLATVRDFVVLGNILSLGPNFIQWSGYNNSETWVSSIKTQSDQQELFGRAGHVQRIVPGESGVIFCEHSIYRMDYIGPPVIFQIDEVERKRGTPAPNSVVWAGGLTYYFGWDGFYVTDGIVSKPISHNRVSNWFGDNCPANTFSEIRSTIDRVNRLVIWSFRTSSSLTHNNRLLIYNWGANRWSWAEIDTQVIEEYVSSGFSLDALDGPLPAGIDTDSINVDSSQYAGGTINVQGFDTSNRGATFDGAALTALIDTKEIGGQGEQRIFVNGIRPLIEGTSAAVITAAVGKRNQLNENVAFTALKAANGINGLVSLRANSRYQRYRCSIAGGFSHADGVMAHVRNSGGRR